MDYRMARADYAAERNLGRLIVAVLLSGLAVYGVLLWWLA